MRYRDLTLAAQTSYAELLDRTRGLELDRALAGRSGSFQKMVRRGRAYWYFAYRDLDQGVRMAYVGPDEPRVVDLVERLRKSRREKPLVAPARAALIHGCAETAPKHFRVIERLAEYGFFRAGGVLVGTHAFLALGNVLGVRWLDAATTLDVDLAHAGHNVSLALPADLRVDVHGALESLELGLLPLAQFNGKLGPQYRHPKDDALRLDFLTARGKSDEPVVVPALNVALQPLRFMELALEAATQACLVARAGSCLVNVPLPECFCVHKLLVYGERPLRERAKATKDILQVAALLDWFVTRGRAAEFNEAWRDAVARGPGWKKRALSGRRELVRVAPELDVDVLWRTSAGR